MSVTTNQPQGMNLPRPKPPIVPVTPENVRDWWVLFMNRKAYTRQSVNPHPETGRHTIINLRIRTAASRWSLTRLRCANTWPAGSPLACAPSTLKVLRDAVTAVANALPNGQSRFLPGKDHNISSRALAPVLFEYFGTS